MGREIRRVPPNWEHPRDRFGNYKPIFDQDYETAAQEWMQALLDFEADKNGEKTKATERGIKFYWDWDGMPPDLDYYRPKWEQEATHYQIYEDVSEGTPISPVFASLGEMKEWILAQGYSEHDADQFIEYEWAPSFIFTSDKGMSPAGIGSLDWIDKE